MKQFITRAVEKEIETQKQQFPTDGDDYVARLQEFARRVSAASQGETTLGDELRRMRDRL